MLVLMISIFHASIPDDGGDDGLTIRIPKREAEFLAKADATASALHGRHMWDRCDWRGVAALVTTCAVRCAMRMGALFRGTSIAAALTAVRAPPMRCVAGTTAV